MPSDCVAPGCDCRRKSFSGNRSLFQFPKDAERRIDAVQYSFGLMVRVQVVVWHWGTVKDTKLRLLFSRAFHRIVIAFSYFWFHVQFSPTMGPGRADAMRNFKEFMRLERRADWFVIQCLYDGFENCSGFHGASTCNDGEKRTVVLYA